jgi:hypothetical protein
MQNRAYSVDECIEKMSVLSLRPGDVLAISTTRLISSEMAARLKEAFKDVVGEVPVLVLSDGLEVGVIRKERLGE